MMHLGQTLRELRIAKGLTLTQLAEQTGTHVGNLSRIERDSTNPSLDLLRRIARALDMALSDIFSIAEEGVQKEEQYRRHVLCCLFSHLPQADQALLVDMAQLLQKRHEQAD